MRKLLPLLFTALLLLGACSQRNDFKDEGVPEAEDAATEETEEVDLEEGMAEDTEPESPSQMDDAKNLHLPSYFHDSDISYYPFIRKLDAGGDFEYDHYVDAERMAKEENEYTPSAQTMIEYLFNWSEVGTIEKAPYEGWKLVVLNVLCEGPCFSTDIYRFALNPTRTEMVYLEGYSSPVNDWTKLWIEPFIDRTDNEIQLQGILLPEQVSIPDTDEELILVNKNIGTSDYLMDSVEYFMETDELGIFYTRGVGCLYYRHPDGTVNIYSYDPGFMQGQEETITWLADGITTNLQEDYLIFQTGCGVINLCYFLHDVDESELEELAETGSGLKLYGPKDKSQKELDPNTPKTSANDILNYQFGFFQYSPRGQEGEEVSFQEYLDLNPVLFWQDPFGRWASIVHKDFKYPGECGKPVIYLYPLEAQDVHVEVGIDEFTKTIPDYGSDGWTVRAAPDGTLMNYADGQEYPYLFWEGHSDKTLPISAGFTVVRGDLESFLLESLEQLGLNDIESQDFMDFWLTRMLDNPEPYFFISFLGTRDFNKVAPLNISPAPDTLIRVFMYYNPTTSSATMPPQQLRSVERDGFTVVEWGGTSSRQWRE